MNKTQELNNAIDFLRYQIASLKSCKRDEIENEWRLVVNAINSVKELQVKGTSAKVNERAANMMQQALDVMNRRSL